MRRELFVNLNFGFFVNEMVLPESLEGDENFGVFLGGEIGMLRGFLEDGFGLALCGEEGVFRNSFEKEGLESRV
jgi:hypothetical protein